MEYLIQSNNLLPPEIVGDGLRWIEKIKKASSPAGGILKFMLLDI
jgi:hypothetical protein